MSGLSFKPSPSPNRDAPKLSHTWSYDSNYTLTNNALTVINDNIFYLIN